MSDDPEAFLPDRQAAARYGVHPKTLSRWDDKPELGFPKPYLFNGRKHRKIGELQVFERRSAVARTRPVDKTEAMTP
jgi:hypothetical protein